MTMWLQSCFHFRSIRVFWRCNFDTLSDGSVGYLTMIYISVHGVAANYDGNCMQLARFSFEPLNNICKWQQTKTGSHFTGHYFKTLKIITHTHAAWMNVCHSALEHVFVHAFLFYLFNFFYSLFIFKSSEKKNRNSEQCVIKYDNKMSQRLPSMMAHSIGWMKCRVVYC